ncbi:hypothetical protein GGX14DRAFT_352104, partial [Mycena pura]
VPPETRAEDVPLLLPSALTVAQRAGGCMSGLLEMEKELRDAQCRTAHQLLLNQLTIKSRLFLYKKYNVRHQGMNTRSRTVVARNESKIRLHSEKYQAAWRALVAIEGGVAERVGWNRLRKEDIRCMEDPEVLSRRQQRKKAAQERELRRNAELLAMGELPLITSGESHRQVSWIWTQAGKSGSDDEFLEALRIEWCKAYARTRRWREDVRLLEAEWDRLPMTLSFLENKWNDRAANVPIGETPVADAEGMIAYAVKQAAMYSELARRAEKTRTEPRLEKGYRQPRPAASTAAYLVMGGDDGDVDEEEDDEGGFLSGDEELIMDG